MPDTRAHERWIVLGGTGFVGRYVVEAAAAAGHDVRQVPAPRLVVTASDPEAVTRAITDHADVRNDLRDAFAGADVVVLAAGLAAPDSGWTPELVGANALLPAVVIAAAQDAGVRRVVHLSSAAVQGRRPVLDESRDTQPFSPYSTSKAWGERLVAEQAEGDRKTEVVVVRATSVQGPGRPTTERLRRLGRSPLASVAGAGAAPTPVTSVQALAEFVVRVADHQGTVPALVLQPWEGMTVSGVLEAAGRRRPVHLPTPLCRAAVGAGHLLARASGGRLSGPVRRVELMWFGQDQVAGWASSAGITVTPRVEGVLTGGEA